MATKRWLGNAVDVQDVWTFTPGGTIAAGSTFTFTVGGISWVYTSTVTTVAGVCAELTDLWNSPDPALQPPPAFRELQANDNTSTVTFTGRVYGRPHTLACDAGGSGSPTETLTNTTPATGRRFVDAAANWSDGAAPANGDVLVFDAGAIDVLYGLGALSSLTTVTVDVRSGYSGRIGLPVLNGIGTSQYAEYRTRHLTLSGGTLIVDAPQCQRCYLDFGSAAATVIVRDTGNRESASVPVVLINGSHSSNAASVIKGDVGFAFYAGQTANFPSLKLTYRDNQVSDAEVECGGGCALGTIVKLGGSLRTRSAITTLTQAQGGGITIIEAGAVTTLNVDGGTVQHNSTDTLTTARVSNDGVLDFDQDPRAKTVTNPINKYGDRSRVRDTNKIVNSAALVVQCIRSSDLEGIEYGADFKVTFGAVS